MLPQEDAIKEICLELSQIYRKRFGRDLDSELIRAEAENIVKRYGPIIAIKEIFSPEEEIRGVGKRILNEEQS
jgi:hypothetical protein